jgi:hypothetical protein
MYAEDALHHALRHKQGRRASLMIYAMERFLREEAREYQREQQMARVRKQLRETFELFKPFAPCPR